MTTASITLPRQATARTRWTMILEECVRQLARLHTANTAGLFR